ncbi:MAG: hypothetical protein R3263_09065, partial [Myxococcota bacterium]|nr:hypothetical protein [Myxococcota bacterium]
MNGRKTRAATRRMRGARAALAVMALLLAGAEARAQASASVSPRRVALGQRAASGPVSLVWTVQSGAGLPPGLSFSTVSGPGVFVGERSGRVLGQLPPLPTRTGPVATFAETVTVPQPVLDTARRDDEQRIVLARRFTTTASGVVGGVPVTRT